MAYVPEQNIKRHNDNTGDQPFTFIPTNSEHTITIEGDANTFAVEAKAFGSLVYVPIENFTLKIGVNLFEIGGCSSLKLIPTNKSTPYSLTISSY